VTVDHEAERLKRLNDLKKQIREAAGLESPAWEAIDNNVDTLGAILAGTGLVLATTATTGPVGWIVATAGAGIAIYDRTIRKPRKAQRELDRLRTLDVLAHHVEKLIDEAEEEAKRTDE
jgi:hypothetical protein